MNEYNLNWTSLEFLRDSSRYAIMSGAMNVPHTPRGTVLCTISRRIIKKEVLGRLKALLQGMANLVGARIPGDLVPIVFEFIATKREDGGGLVFYRFSFPLAMSIMLHLHEKHDDVDVKNWIEYPFLLQNTNDL